MIGKVGVAVLAVILLIPMLIAGAVSGAISAVFGSGSSQPSATALADIPADYLALYREAAGVCPGLDWTILAAIGKIETDHGRSSLRTVTWNGWLWPWSPEWASCTLVVPLDVIGVSSLSAPSDR